MPSFQIGGIPGHRVEEHLFVIKSFLALVKKNKTAVAFQQYDFSKMFNSESLIDVLDKVYKSKVKGKLLRLSAGLNPKPAE